MDKQAAEFSGSDPEFDSRLRQTGGTTFYANIPQNTNTVRVPGYKNNMILLKKKTRTTTETTTALQTLYIWYLAYFSKNLETLAG